MRIRVSFGGISLLLLAILVPLSNRMWAQDAGQSMATPEQIALELKQIEDATARHETNLEVGKLWCLLAIDYEREGDAARAEDSYARSLKLLRDENPGQYSYGVALDALGSLYGKTGRLAEAEEVETKAAAIFEKQGELVTEAAVRGHIALDMLSEKRYGEAEREASVALDGLMGHKDEVKEWVSALVVRAYARCLTQRCGDGLTDARQAMEMVRSLLAPDSSQAVAAWMVLGYALWKTKDDAAAGDAMREGLRIVMEKKDLPPAMLVSDRVGAMRQYALFLRGTHHKAEAQQMEREMAQLQGAQGTVCQSCTVSVAGLSNAFR